MSISIIKNDRLLLKPFEENMITDEYISWLNDKELLKYSQQKNHTHTFLTSSEYIKSFKNSGNKFWGILDRKKMCLIGTITAYFNTSKNQVDIGILIGNKDARGKGHGKDAWKLVVDNMFMFTTVSQVTGGTQVENISMMKIFKFMNMKKFDEYVIEDDSETNSIIKRFKITKKEWLRINRQV